MNCLTCSLLCFPQPDPVVEGLRSLLPYLYTPQALSATERIPELDRSWIEAPLFGVPGEVWQAYRAAITRDRESYALRGGVSISLGSNFEVLWLAR